MATVRLRLFGPAREAAGTGQDSVEAGTVAEAMEVASTRYGATFAAVLGQCRLWVNGDDQDPGGSRELCDGDEVAVLPPVSGG